MKVGLAPTRLAFLCFLLALSRFPVAGEATGSGRIQVEAKRLEYDAESQTLAAYAGQGEEVDVRAEGLRLSCGTLSLKMDAGGRELRQLAAAGGLHIGAALRGETERQAECWAQSLTYSPKDGMVSAVGGVQARLRPASAFGGLEWLQAEEVGLVEGGKVATARGKVSAQVVRGDEAQRGISGTVKGDELRYESEAGRVEVSGGPSEPWVEMEFADPNEGRKIESRSRSATLAQWGEESITLKGEGQLASSTASGESMSLRADSIEYAAGRGEFAASGAVQGGWNPGKEEAAGTTRLTCAADSLSYAEEEKLLRLRGTASAALEDTARPEIRRTIQGADEVAIDLKTRETTASGGIVRLGFPGKNGAGVELSLKGESMTLSPEKGRLEATGSPVIVEGNGFTLSCPEINGLLGEDGRLETLSALGGISFAGQTETRKAEGRAQEAIYSAEGQTITAKGEVSGSISAPSGGGTTAWENADTAVYHLDSGNVDVSGERVKMTLPAPAG